MESLRHSALFAHLGDIEPAALSAQLPVRSSTVTCVRARTVALLPTRRALPLLQRGYCTVRHHALPAGGIEAVAVTGDGNIDKIDLEGAGEGTRAQDDGVPLSPCPVDGGMGTVEMPPHVRKIEVHRYSTYRSTVQYWQLLETHSELLHGVMGEKVLGFWRIGDTYQRASGTVCGCGEMYIKTIAPPTESCGVPHWSVRLRKMDLDASFSAESVA